MLHSFHRLFTEIGARDVGPWYDPLSFFVLDIGRDLHIYEFIEKIVNPEVTQEHF